MVNDGLITVEQINVVQDVKNSANDALQPIEAQGAHIIYNLDQWEKYDKAVSKTTVDLEKLASNERIKAIEAKVELNIAELESDTKKAVALIEAVGDTISDSSDLLGDLFGELNDADNFRDKFNIEDEIDKQSERLDEALELQRKQVESQLRLDRLKAERLKNGGALITVNGDGLQPHLEAFMWEILEAIQVRVNADGYEMLLGGP